MYLCYSIVAVYRVETPTDIDIQRSSRLLIGQFQTNANPLLVYMSASAAFCTKCLKCLICFTQGRHRLLLKAVPCGDDRSQSAASV